MALAALTVWVPGQVLTAAALNAEFANIRNNPISLLSPTTGVINFNLQQHTNLLPSVVSATSGAAGQALITTGGSAVWGIPTVPVVFTSLSSGQLLIGTSSGGITPLAVATTGQVLVVTSSNTGPVWGVVPPAGGLSTGTPTIGAMYFISNTASGPFVPLAIGTSGQVLTVSTGGLPVWAAAGAGTAGTVRATTLIVSSGNLAITTTSFVSMLPAALSITPATTAARLNIHAMGSVLTSSPAIASSASLSYTLFLDGANLGGAVDGFLQQDFGMLTGAVDGLQSFNLNFLTSVVSTAAHTVDARVHVSSAGTNHLVLRGDPVLAVSVYEVPTTG